MFEFLLGWVIGACLAGQCESPAEREKRERRIKRENEARDKRREKDLRVVAKRVLEENMAPIPCGGGPSVWAEIDSHDQEIAKQYGVREWDRSTFLRVLHEERRRMFESGEAPDWVE